MGLKRRAIIVKLLATQSLHIVNDSRTGLLTGNNEHWLRTDDILGQFIIPSG